MEDKELKKMLKKIDQIKLQIDKNEKLIDELEAMILEDHPEYAEYIEFDE